MTRELLDHACVLCDAPVSQREYLRGMKGLCAKCRAAIEVQDMGYVSVFRARLADEAVIAYGEALEEYFNAVENGGGQDVLQ